MFFSPDILQPSPDYPDPPPIHHHHGDCQQLRADPWEEHIPQYPGGLCRGAPHVHRQALSGSPWVLWHHIVRLHSWQVGLCKNSTHLMSLSSSEGSAVCRNSGHLWLFFSISTHRADIITESQSKGLGNFVSKFALPALLFKNMVLLDFGDVIWAFLWSVLVAKVGVCASVLGSLHNVINYWMAYLMCVLTGQTHSDKLTGVPRSAYHCFIVDGSSLFGMFITES